MDERNSPLEGLEDVEISTGLDEDVRFKIVDILADRGLTDMFSDLSMEEIKLLVRLQGLAEAFDDDIKRKIVRFYLVLKCSKERLSRSKLEDMGTVKLPVVPTFKEKARSFFGMGKPKSNI